MRIQIDGEQFVAIPNNFSNLQESPAIYFPINENGIQFLEAMEKERVQAFNEQKSAARQINYLKVYQKNLEETFRTLAAKKDGKFVEPNPIFPSHTASGTWRNRVNTIAKFPKQKKGKTTKKVKRGR
jgi:hypothetical protein